MQLFKFPLNEICNCNVSLKEINGQTARDLEEKMNEATTFQQRVGIAETYLFDLLKNNSDSFEFRRINHYCRVDKTNLRKYQYQPNGFGGLFEP
jgi:hypothetical protein